MVLCALSADADAFGTLGSAELSFGDDEVVTRLTSRATVIFVQRAGITRRLNLLQNRAEVVNYYHHTMLGSDGGRRRPDTMRGAIQARRIGSGNIVRPGKTPPVGDQRTGPIRATTPHGSSHVACGKYLPET